MSFESLTALITPFHQGRVDIDNFNKLIKFQCEQGTDGFVINGTTGESTSLTDDERCLLIRHGVENKQGRKIIVGCGTPSVQKTLENIHMAQDQGADAVLIITPYYVKPTQQGIVDYIRFLHDNSHIPFILYNNPARTHVKIDVSTLATLCTLERVVGLKESDTDVLRMVTLHQQFNGRLRFYCGEDSSLGAHLLAGCQGIISVASNVLPRLCKDVLDAFENDNMIAFKKKITLWQEFTRVLSKDGNPTGIKYALSVRGMCHNELRLPLVPTENTECEMMLKKLQNQEWRAQEESNS